MVVAWGFVAVGVIRDPTSTFDLLPTTGFAVAVTLRTLALFGLFGALVGVLVGGLCAVLGRPRAAAAITFGLGVALTVMAYATAWWQLEVLAGTPFDHPLRRTAAFRHAAIALAAGLAAFAACWLAIRHSSGSWRRPALGLPAAACLLLLVLDLGPLRLRGARQPMVEPPATIAVIGLDGVTFRVLRPLLRAGELPAFRELIDDGAWGTLLTYGVASSPLVWTSVATGKRARDHGITDFVTHRGSGYGARSMRRSDWRARPFWSLVGEAGRDVAVVNWLMSAPPEPVAGAIVTRLSLASRGKRAFPSSLEAPVEAILSQPRPYDDDAHQAETLGHVDDVFDVTEMLLDVTRPGFLAVYQSATDGAEHTTWRHYEPSAFDSTLWPVAAERDETLATLIPDAYRQVDRRLGALLDRLGDDALVFVLSDHGQRAAAMPRVRPRLDRLLIGLGFARPGEGGGLAPKRSQAYPLLETPWTPTLRINLNLKGREPRGKVSAEDYRARIDALSASLESVRFLDGEPVFEDIVAQRRPAAPGDRSDLTLRLGRRARSAREGDAWVRVGGFVVPLRAIVEVDPSISGDHDRQGVLFVRGPGVRPGPIGQRTLNTPLQSIVRHLTDRVPAIDAALPWLGRIGLVERATTLDITPSVLASAGLPIGRDMAGRALTEILALPNRPSWVDTWETGQGPATDVEIDGTDEEMLERLRALGYVN